MTLAFLVTSLVLFGFMGQVWAKELGFGVTNSAYLYTVFSVGSMTSAIMGGLLGDRFVKRFGHKGRIMLFQIYAVLFGTVIALTMYFSHWWDSDVAPLTEGVLKTNDPSVMYYVMVFLMGLTFSIGFSGWFGIRLAGSVAERLKADRLFPVRKTRQTLRHNMRANRTEQWP
mgnify:CR=1 FL=1